MKLPRNIWRNNYHTFLKIVWVFPPMNRFTNCFQWLCRTDWDVLHPPFLHALIYYWLHAICLKQIFDVKTSYVAFRLFRLGSDIFRALLFSRNASAFVVLNGGDSMRCNDLAICAQGAWLHYDHGLRTWCRRERHISSSLTTNANS